MDRRIIMCRECGHEWMGGRGEGAGYKEIAVEAVGEDRPPLDPKRTYSFAPATAALK